MAYNTGTDPTLTELRIINGVGSAFIPELFSAKVLLTLKNDLVVVNAVSHTYQADLRIGYKVTIPVFTAPTVAEVTPGTELTKQDCASASPVTITIDKWWGAAAEISEMADIEQNADYLAGAATEIAHVVAQKIDTDVGALFRYLNSDTVYGADGQTFTDDIIIAITEVLDEANVPTSERVIIGDPSTRADIRKIDKWMRTDYITGKPAMNGQLTDIYGMPVLITNNLTAATTGNYGVIMHKTALAVVIQQNPTSQRIPEPIKHRIVYQVKAIWGEDEIRDAAGYAFYTRKS